MQECTIQKRMFVFQFQAFVFWYRQVSDSTISGCNAEETTGDDQSLGRRWDWDAFQAIVGEGDRNEKHQKVAARNGWNKQVALNNVKYI